MTTMSFVALSSFARNARKASRVGVGSALCVALNVTSIRFRSGFSLRCRTSSCIGYRSIRRRTSRALDFAVSSTRTTTTPWDGMPYRTAPDGGASAMQTRARRSSSPRTSTRTRSSDLKASESTCHASGVIVAGGFVTRKTFDPIRCSASRSSGSACRFVLKSTTQMSGVRAGATRSSVQKSPTVTTGLERPIVGKMLGPCVRAAIGHRRYSRSDSGRRNVTSANSANAGGELPADMDAHLLLPRRPFVQGHRNDARADLVADPEVALRVFADQPLALLVHVDPIVHDLRDVQKAVQRTESHERAELKDFHHRAFDDLLQGRCEHEGVVPHPLVDGAVPVDDAAFADALDVARDQGEGLVRPDLAFQGGAGELPGDRVDVLPKSLRRDPDDVFPLDPLVHENRLAAVPVPPI